MTTISADTGTTVARAIPAAFVRGLTRPSIAAAFGTLGVTGLLILACVLGINPAFMRSVPTGYLLTDPFDHHAYLSGEAFKLRERPRSGPEVILVGASSAAAALSSGDHLERLLEDDLGRSVPVHNLCVPGLTLWEMSSLLDFLGGADGVVVVTIGRLLLCDSVETLQSRARRLAFRTAALDEEAHRVGATLPPPRVNFFHEHLDFFAARTPALANVFRGPVTHTHRPDIRPVESQERWEAQFEWVNGDIDIYFDNVERNLGVLARMMELARERGNVRFVLLEAPRNPYAVPYLQPDHFARHQEICRAFAAEHDAEYWYLDGEAAFAREQFGDFCHIIDDDTRGRFTEILATRLAAVIARSFPEARP